MTLNAKAIKQNIAHNNTIGLLIISWYWKCI